MLVMGVYPFPALHITSYFMACVFYAADCLVHNKRAGMTGFTSAHISQTIINNPHVMVSAYRGSMVIGSNSLDEREFIA
jgi:hypothetical protein